MSPANVFFSPVLLLYVQELSMMYKISNMVAQRLGDRLEKLERTQFKSTSQRLVYMSHILQWFRVI